MDEMILARKLKDYADKFRAYSANTPTPEALSVVEFHLRLADFILARPFVQEFDFPDPDRLPSSLREITRAANSAFRIQQPQEMRIKLESLISRTHHLQNMTSGTEKALYMAGKKWHSAIEDIRNPACLSLTLSPSLDLESRVRELQPDEDSLVSEVPVSITNSGLLPAYDAVLTIVATKGTEPLEIKAAKLLKAGTWQIEIKPEVIPGRPTLLVLQSAP